jgi:hypothetical protein
MSSEFRKVMVIGEDNITREMIKQLVNKLKGMSNHCLEALCLDCYEIWCLRCGRQYGKTDPKQPLISVNIESRPIPVKCPEYGSKNVVIK